jgi:transposase
MDERLRFVARLLEGEAMSEVCREFGISRKTGCKIFDRYKDHGLEALSDRSRRPVRYANQLLPQIESLITACKREKPDWGARKIRELLVRKLDGDFRIPAKSTIHAVLCRHDLVKPMGRPRRRATGTSLSETSAPNALWCADFKGEFKLGRPTPRDFCCSAKRSNPRAKIPPSPPSNSSFASEACRWPFAPTMACPSQVPTASLTSPDSPFGGCAWASPSSASSPAIPSRTAAMSACI